MILNYCGFKHVTLGYLNCLFFLFKFIIWKIVSDTLNNLCPSLSLKAPRQQSSKAVVSKTRLVAATNRPGRSGTSKKEYLKTNSSWLSATVSERKEITEALVKATKQGVVLTPRRGASGRKSKNSCQEGT